MPKRKTCQSCRAKLEPDEDRWCRLCRAQVAIVSNVFRASVADLNTEGLSPEETARLMVERLISVGLLKPEDG